MFMPAVDLELGPPVDPDELDMPESPEHDHAVYLIRYAAELYLPGGVELFSNMNWYPRDGGNAVAPDVMILPAGLLERGKKSYRPTEHDPLPLVVVEVPSDSDSFGSFRLKVARYRRLGVLAYAVSVEGAPEVLRSEPGDPVDHPWSDRPIPELGGIAVGVDDLGVYVRTPVGLVARTPTELTALMLQSFRAQAEAAEAQVRAAEARAEANEAAVARLTARLRELGLDL